MNTIISEQYGEDMARLLSEATQREKELHRKEAERKRDIKYVADIIEQMRKNSKTLVYDALNSIVVQLSSTYTQTKLPEFAKYNEIAKSIVMEHIDNYFASNVRK